VSRGFLSPGRNKQLILVTNMANGVVRVDDEEGLQEAF
jgi:hypothetical protein